MSSKLAIFSESVYLVMTEHLAENIKLFNKASNNAIMLAFDKNVGDYSDAAFWQMTAEVVRRRNINNPDGKVKDIAMGHLVETMVKVAAGTNRMVFPNAKLNWIQRNPEEAALIFGKQVAEGYLADILNTSLTATAAALGQHTQLTHDVTSQASKTISYDKMVQAAGKFGDASDRIQCWVMHSLPKMQLTLGALNNANRLFQFGTVGIDSDANGRPIIVTDIAATVSSDVYNVLGLVQGAIVAEDNGDWFDNEDRINGKENIEVSYQAEWSYNLGIKGFSWNKEAGGASPTDSALATATNWKKNATSFKDTAGVLLKVKAAD